MKFKPAYFWGFLFFGGWNSLALAQFNTIPGKANSIAIHGDSSCFVNWASEGAAFPGLRQINVPDSGMASVGTINSALGKHRKNGVISLGDGGSVVLRFPHPIVDGTGFDFAVFENAFNDSFLELAHVEVSHDGKRFFRFPSISESQINKQTEPFGTTYPDSIHNLAGRFRMPYGTPFDLNDFKDTPDFPTTIYYVKIIDVVGSIDPRWGSRDSRGNLINDPWPTNFASSGFDLDAVGVINQLITNSNNQLNQMDATITIENPQIASTGFLHLHLIQHPESLLHIEPLSFDIFNATGTQVFSQSIELETTLPINNSIILKHNLNPGMYFIHLKSKKSLSLARLKIILE